MLLLFKDELHIIENFIILNDNINNENENIHIEI